MKNEKLPSCGDCKMCVYCGRWRIRQEQVKQVPVPIENLDNEDLKENPDNERLRALAHPQRKRRVQKSDPAYGKQWRYLKKYGITTEDYNAMLGEQEGKCLICKQEKSLVVDHCHTTGLVRGLLCQSCNKGLGFFKDSPEFMAEAIRYIKSV